LSFNAECVAEFFAQVEHYYQKYNITEGWQVFNLDETGFTPGRDLDGSGRHGVVTTIGNRAVTSRVTFQYEHRISVLGCVNAVGKSFQSTAVFKGVREPKMNVFLSLKPVSRIMPEPWTAMWRRDSASVDSAIFRRWALQFVATVRQIYPGDR